MNQSIGNKSVVSTLDFTKFIWGDSDFRYDRITLD